MTFAQAVQRAPAPIPAAFRAGKQALKAEHRDLVRCANPRRFTGSIALDNSLRAVRAHAAANRWDYGLGIQDHGAVEVAIWIEVHPATTGEVETVLCKHKWLVAWLQNEAESLRLLTRRTSRGKNFYWLATAAGVHIRPGSPQARKLQQAGLDLPKRVVSLDG